MLFRKINLIVVLKPKTNYEVPVIKYNFVVLLRLIAFMPLYVSAKESGTKHHMILNKK